MDSLESQRIAKEAEFAALLGGLNRREGEIAVLKKLLHDSEEALESLGLRHEALERQNTHLIALLEKQEGKVDIPLLARTIINRIVENAIRLQWTRNIEPVESDPDADFPTEDELVVDALALALGDDTGCLSEEDEDFRERIDLLWLEDLLRSRLQEGKVVEVPEVSGADPKRIQEIRVRLEAGGGYATAARYSDIAYLLSLFPSPPAQGTETDK